MGLTTSGGAAARHPLHHRRPSGWPFKVQPGMAPAITTSDLGVGVPRRQEVEFADGSKVWLLRVEKQGVPDLFLRELGLPAAGVLVDLRHLVPELARDLPRASTRDVPGLVHFSLRGRFGGVQALLEEAIAIGRPE